jgi:hypothetical protein
MDKGFGSVVDLLEWMSLKQLAIPMVIQTSPDHYGKYDDRTREEFKRLQKVNYPALRTCPQVLDSQSYSELFQGAICLQLYSQQDFADRISGVTLDALSAGSPVITLPGTWMARVVAEFDAGIVVESSAPDHVYNAITVVMGQFDIYRDNALKAGRELQLRHNAGHLLHRLTAEEQLVEGP